jgi:hypothetical protein
MEVISQNPCKRRHFTAKVKGVTNSGRVFYIGTFDKLSEAIKYHRDAFIRIRDYDKNCGLGFKTVEN